MLPDISINSAHGLSIGHHVSREPQALDSSYYEIHEITLWSDPER